MLRIFFDYCVKTIWCDKKYLEWIYIAMNEKNLKILKIIIISVVGLTVLIGLGYVLFYWNQPLSDPLDLPSDTQLGSDGTEAADLSTDGTDRAEGSDSPAIEPVCGAPPTINILVSGVASNNFLYGLADAIRLVRVDFQHQKVTVLAMPRDLWVTIPGIEDHGIKEGKLNQAYFYGTEGMGFSQVAGYGSGLLAETLLENYDYRADFYLAVNLNSFRKIIDTLGGIDVYLAGDSYIKSYGQPKLFLKAGNHHLNGKQAEMLARNRISIGDLGRINNQTVILRALAVRLVSPEGITALPALVDQLISNVLTDLSPEDISQMICLAGMIDQKEDIEFLTLPEDLMEQTKVFDEFRGITTSVFIGDTESISSLLEDFQRGEWP